ncbi:HD-GYP domain-containing protein [Bacillus timonensis]|nr:HD-GYP domain-containing protein [Bacillus timonensis]
MILVATDSLKEGTKLAKPVISEHGKVLIANGVPITTRMISRLLELGITYVYMEDERTKDIVAKHAISEKLRKEAIHTIESILSDIQKEMDLSKSFILEKTTKGLLKLIRSILNETRNNRDLITLLSDVYSYDNYIFTHSLNVTLYTVAIGLELKLTDKQLETLALGAILHDVGKMAVPLDVLLKPGKLTNDEFDSIKQHTEVGFEILRNVSSIPLVAAHCAYQHHERLDGSGYPRGIKGNDIHYFAKIIAVSDVFDAVTSNRVYRKALLPHEGLEILYYGVGKLFDSSIVEAFRRSVVIYPVGLTVYLSDGRKGIVSQQNKGLSERPIVRILEEQGKKIESTYEVDLKKDLHIVITGCDTTLIHAEKKVSG